MIVPGAYYHVSTRTNRGEMIFNNRSMKQLFLRVLQEARRKYSFRLENFCIMGNHFHLLIKPVHNANLSAIMQWINSVFALRFNKAMRFTGHVWGERFFSIVLFSLTDFLRTFAYIDDNPVVAGLVTSSEPYAFSGKAHEHEGWRTIVDEPDLLRRLLFPGRIPTLLARQHRPT
ncbi:MAG TPA: transposase [bacterium]|nr:transposase [bacterium]